MSDNTARVDKGEIKPERPKGRGSPTDLSETPAISPETIFGLLADPHRRAVFAYLENTEDGQATVSHLAAYTSQHACAGNSPSQIMIQLHHTHLPKVAKAGLIEYDPEQETVQYIGHPLIEDCLELLDD